MDDIQPFRSSMFNPNKSLPELPRRQTSDSQAQSTHSKLKKDPRRGHTSLPPPPPTLDATRNRSRAHARLSAHYLPTKFSRPNSGVFRRRKKVASQLKIGGGRLAFGKRQRRMPEVDDEDYDGLDISKRPVTTLRWTGFKWCLFVSNVIVRE